MGLTLRRGSGLVVPGEGARVLRRRLLVDGAWRAIFDVRKGVLDFASVSEVVSF